MSATPRVVISAPTSGQGKTGVAVGLLAAYTARGMHSVGFKVGPDYIDAANLGLATGRTARNLDPRLVGAERIGPLFVHGSAGADIAVVEGTMGLFDGLAGRTDGASTANLAGLLRAPVVLVVDVAAMGQSIAALVHGFRVYDELLWLGGVILNRVASGRHEELLREALADIGVPVLGVVRQRDLASAGALPSRSQGVVPARHRSLDAVRVVRRMGEVIAGSVDLERVLVLARSAPGLAAEAWSPEGELAGDSSAQPVEEPRRPVVALAAGYGYAETAELLTAAGAEVAVIDPLRDEALPEGATGLVIPAGLPESYADVLSANESLRHAVRELVRTGGAVVAEGTGSVWLCRELDGRPMCGVLDAAARTTDLLVVGYRDATTPAASWLLPAGASVVGHKLHRILVSPRAGAQPAWSWPRGQPEGYVGAALHASSLALHWAGRPSIAVRVVAAAANAAAANTAAANTAAAANAAAANAAAANAAAATEAVAVPPAAATAPTVVLEKSDVDAA